MNREFHVGGKVECRNPPLDKWNMIGPCGAASRRIQRRELGRIAQAGMMEHPEELLVGGIDEPPGAAHLIRCVGIDVERARPIHHVKLQHERHAVDSAVMRNEVL